jgi:hypothetical protein
MTMPKDYDKSKSKGDKIDITPKPNSSPPPGWDPRRYKGNDSSTNTSTSSTKIGALVLVIIMIIIVVGVTAWVWSENEKDFNEIQNITCEQYNLSEEECERAIEEAKARAE